MLPVSACLSQFRFLNYSNLLFLPLTLSIFVLPCALSFYSTYFYYCSPVLEFLATKKMFCPLLCASVACLCVCCCVIVSIPFLLLPVLHSGCCCVIFPLVVGLSLSSSAFQSKNMVRNSRRRKRYAEMPEQEKAELLRRRRDANAAKKRKDGRMLMLSP